MRWRIIQRINAAKSRLLLLLASILLTLPILHLTLLIWKELEFFPELPQVKLNLEQSHHIALDPKAPIPRLIHQSWKTKKLPPRFSSWAESWSRCLPSWQYRLWTDADNRQFVRAHFPEFFTTWAALPTSIERVDSVRYLYMYFYGGVYADLDCECIRPFEHLLTNCSIVLASMSVGNGWMGARMPSGLIQNSFMYSRPGHGLWREAVGEVARIANRRWINAAVGSYPTTEDRTGPMLLMHVLARSWHKYKDSICIYPPEFFNPFSWYEDSMEQGCQTLNRMTNKQAKQCRIRYNDSYVVQYHTQVWRHGSINMVDGA